VVVAGQGIDQPMHEDVTAQMDDLEIFERHRAQLQAVAFRILGSRAEAEDALQEAWIRVRRAGMRDVDNPGGWLTTVVSRVCLTMLDSRARRREDGSLPDMVITHADEDAPDPEREALMADAVGSALTVVLDTLAPAERIAFVLHDFFGLPFDDVATVLDRSPAAARQLASRARRRVQGAATDPGADLARQRRVVDAFLAASRGGDFGALVAVLDPEVVLRADAAAVRAGASGEVHGAAEVAGTFSGRARAARPALVNGAAGAVWIQHGQPRMVFGFTISGGKIAAIDLLADPERISQLDLVVLRG
jgi:RNA polymerase sigma factor (sigma-70 family)